MKLRGSGQVGVGFLGDGAGGSVGNGEAWGGPLGATQGLKTKYPNRMLDTPISESAFSGAAVSAAAAGLRPITELMFVRRRPAHGLAAFADPLPAVHARARLARRADRGRGPLAEQRARR